MGRPKTSETDLIRVDKRFAETLRRMSKETGDSIINITSGININGCGNKRKRGRDPFALQGLD